MKEFYTAKDLIEILGFSKNTIYKYLDEGKIKGVRVGKGGYRVPRAEVEKWLGERGKKGGTILPNKSVEVETGVERVLGEVGRKNGNSKRWLEFSRVSSGVDLFDWLVFLLTITISLSLFLLPIYFYRIKLGEILELVYTFRVLFLISGILYLVFSVNKEKQKKLYRGVNFWLAMMFFALGVINWRVGEGFGAVLYMAVFLMLLVRGVKKRTVPVICFTWLVFAMSLMTSLVLAFGKMQVNVMPTGKWYGWVLVFLLLFGALIASLQSVKGDKKFFRWIMFLHGGLFLWVAMRLVGIGIWDRVFAYMIIGTMSFLFVFEEMFTSRIKKNGKKFIWIFAYTILVLLVSILVMSMVRRVFRSMTENDLLTGSEMVVVEVDDFFNQAEDNLLALSKNGLMWSLIEVGDFETVEELVKTMADSSKEMMRVGFLDKDGFLRAVYPHAEPDLIGTDFSLRGYFEKSKKGEINISDLFEAKMKGEPWTVVASVPIYNDQGSFGGVLFGCLDMKKLGERVEMQRKTEKGSVIVLDSNGRVLVDSSGERLFEEIKREDGDVLYEDVGDGHFTEEWLENKDLMLRIHRKVEGHGYGVILEESVDELEEKMIEVLLPIVGVTVIVLFGGLSWILEQKRKSENGEKLGKKGKKIGKNWEKDRK